MEPLVQVQRLTKRFDQFTALDEVTLETRDGLLVQIIQVQGFPFETREDEELNYRKQIRETLLRRGYYVLEAVDGEDAMRLVADMEKRPDALVTDLMMPNLGGRELAESLGRRYGPLPVLYISGYTQEAAMAESLLKPGEKLLSKPFSASSLAEAVSDLFTPGVHS